MAKATKRLDGKVELLLETEREICAVRAVTGSVIGDPKSTLRGETDAVFYALKPYTPCSFSAVSATRGSVAFDAGYENRVIDPKHRTPGIGDRVKVYNEATETPHDSLREIVALDVERNAVRLAGDKTEDAWFVSDGKAYRYGRCDYLVLAEPEA